MSADACIVWYGVRCEIAPGEVDALESRRHPLILAAREAGLKHYWANFGSPGEKYFLFLGVQVGVLGPENSTEVRLEGTDLLRITSETKERLSKAGISGVPSLYAQWLTDI